MRPISIFVAILSVSLICLVTQNAWGLGDETLGNEPLNEANYTEWKGIMPVVNDKTRVYASWVNGNEHLQYKGDTKQLNEALANFAKVEVKTHEVVLRSGPGMGHTFGRKEVPHNWELHIQGGISKHVLTLDKCKEVWQEDPVLTIYVSGEIDLAKLEIPKGITLLDVPTLSKRIVAGLTASKDKTVRGWGCGQLARLDPYNAENMATIVKMLDDSDNWVRLNATSCLATFGKKAAPHLPALRECLISEDDGLKQSAQRALVEIEQAEDKSDAEKAHAAAQTKIAEFLAGRQAK